MNKYLLDTNILIEASLDNLSPLVRDVLLDPHNFIIVSWVSLWEIVTKQQLGKLSVPDDFIDNVYSAAPKILGVDKQHLAVYKNLPLLHKDPFDRLIIAQSIAEQIPCITKDKIFAKYLTNVVLV